MATYTETDDASRREGVAARGLGAGVWAWALKPEQILSALSRYLVPSAFPVVFRRPSESGGETVRSASGRSKPPQPKEEHSREGSPMSARMELAHFGRI